MIANGRHPEGTVARPGWLPVYRWVAGLFTGLVLLQALLAGRGWFLDRDFIDLHGTVANVVFLTAVAQVALAFVVARRGPLPLLAAALLVLVVVQVGLGFASEESADAAAWHIPNGVLIAALAAAHTVMVAQLKR